jgi:integrase
LFPDSEWVFPSPKRGHLTASHLARLHDNLKRAHDLPKEFYLYSLRHTFATRLAESCNGDTFILMKALGHADEKMCRRYVHIRQDYLTVAMRQKELMDAAIRGETETVTDNFTTIAKKTRI